MNAMAGKSFPKQAPEYKKRVAKDKWRVNATVAGNDIRQTPQYRNLSVKDTGYKIWEDKWLHLVIAVLTILLIILLK